MITKNSIMIKNNIMVKSFLTLILIYVNNNRVSDNN